MALLDRHDTKYIFNREELIAMLPQLQEHYRVLEVNGNRASLYHSLYFDSENLDFYSLHQRGKKNRLKIRMRKYVDSSLTFLEVKLKNNKGRTVKSRVEIDDIEETLSPANLKFIEEAAGKQDQLGAQIFNEFHRITLVHKVEKERLTLDIHLTFKDTNGEKS
ncbi:MAG: polyphosphate polymerase domain-containing protein, partial [Flavobacteriales bacterium]|nr:polyphosphate polymerase domain-containing protein [Flavobacteriales bacterium]